MKRTFTYSDILLLEKEEAELSRMMHEETPAQEPDENLIGNILAYSKALSVRPSAFVEHVVVVNN